MFQIRSLVICAAFWAVALTVASAQSEYSTQTDRQRAAVVVPSSVVDEKIGLIEGKVLVVYDGDTISVQSPARVIYSVRLQGIDAPEDKQNYSKKSRESLTKSLIGKDVRVVVHKKDLYDRYIGTVYLNGEDIGLTQIEKGMAWFLKPYSYQQSPESRKKYAQAELRARAVRAGLWEDRDPTPPWIYRGEVVVAPAPAPTSASLSQSTQAKPTEKSSEPNADGGSSNNSRVYVLGPRGGCYYVAENGRKVYVKDKSLCAK